MVRADRDEHGRRAAPGVRGAAERDVHQALTSRLGAVLAQRCPVCLRGAMFEGRFSMRQQCPSCGHRFMREPGFFQGAMYVSYVLATAVFLVLVLAVTRLLGSRIGFWASLGLAAVLQMLLVPALYRYSRVIWAHLNVRTHP